MSSTEELIGRSDVNDLEAILSVTNTDVDEALDTVADNADAIFTWDYEKGARPALNKLYEKAKHSQWNGETDLDWSIDVDPDAQAMAAGAKNGKGTPVTPKWAAVEADNPIKAALTAYLTGQKSLDQAVSDADAAINKSLSAS